MEQHEQDLQRFMQIREEIHQEISKISPNVLQLQEVTNRFITHFDAFQKFSQNAQDQLKSTIKNASFEIGELVIDEVCNKLEDQIQNILRTLERSVGEARSVIENVSKKNIWKTVTIITLLVLLSLSLGFCMGGYYYEKRFYSLSREFLKTHK